MTRFIDAAATTHVLSLTAMEEASRVGQRTADIDHLFLALVVNEQAAGRVLRSFGITIETAREAVAAQHAEQLATLGIVVDPPDPGRITYHETGGYAWSGRAEAVIKSVTGTLTDAGNVLRALLAEPSGLITEILHRLGTTPEQIADRLDESEHAESSYAGEPGALAGVLTSFAPAPIEQVWALLAAPARMPEWEPAIGSVDDLPAEVQVGDSWVARGPEQRPDGKPLRIKPAYQRSRIELADRVEGHLIGWVMTFPDAVGANTKHLRIELDPVEGGTQVRIALSWVPGDRSALGWLPRRHSALGWVMRPFARLAVRLQLTQLAGGISRAFR